MPKLYGMTSGGTRPSTRSITKNAEPTAAVSSSSQRTAGTGTAPTTSCMTWNCMPMS